MKEFMMKQIEIGSKDGLITVIRSRNTSGYAGITIRLIRQAEDDIQKAAILMTFTNENNNDYEDQVRELIGLLNTIVDNNCLIP